MQLDVGNLVVIGIGGHSSLGGIANSAAAHRAGLNRMKPLLEWPYFDEETLNEQHVIGCAGACINAGFRSLARIIKLGRYAAVDLTNSLEPQALKSRRTALVLVLPRGTDDVFLAEQAISEIEHFVRSLNLPPNVEIEFGDVTLIQEGGLGFVSALQQCSRLLRDGVVEQCLVGVFDSRLSINQLTPLLNGGRVKTVDVPTGLIPGEAACLFLISSVTSAKSGGLTPLAYLSDGFTEHDLNLPLDEEFGDGIEGGDGQETQSSQEDEEDAHADDRLPPNGETQAAALVNVVKSIGVEADEELTIYCDMNGEDYKANDFGSAIVKLASEYPVSNWKVEIPAATFGDMGACDSAMSVCLAVRAFERQYAHGKISLITNCTENHTATAFAVRRPVDGEF